MIFYEDVLLTEAMELVMNMLTNIGGRCVDPARKKPDRSPIDFFREAPSQELYLVAIGFEELLVTPDASEGLLAFDASLDYPDQLRNHLVIRLMQNVIEECLMVLDSWWYAFIDLAGDPPSKLYSSVRSANLHWFFWANYWSPGYLKNADLALRSLQKPSPTPLPSGGLKYMTRKWPEEKLDKAKVWGIQKQLGGERSVSIYLPGTYNTD